VRSGCDDSTTHLVHLHIKGASSPPQRDQGHRLCPESTERRASSPPSCPSSKATLDLACTIPAGKTCAGLTRPALTVHIHRVMNMQPAIMLDRLRVVRGGRVVLDDVSLEVAPGSVTGLLGPSGGGKSTLMRSVVGVQQVAGGEIRVLGLPAGSAPLRHRVGYRTQAPSVYADLSVRENLRYFAAILGAPASDVDRVLDEVDLRSHVDDVVGRLSGGQEARVSLAVALLGAPELLVLDEPTVGLDPVLRRDLWTLFRSLADRGTTLLVSSHVMDEAVHCDRLLLLRDGRLLADETREGLLASTGASDVEAAFLSLVDDVTGPGDTPPAKPATAASTGSDR
jgi:ABC-2 type transport system ATP-binding protein